MADEGIRVEIKGTSSGGRVREPTLRERERAAEADLAAALAERAAAFAERDRSTRELLAVKADALRSEQAAVEQELREAHEYHDTDRLIAAQRSLANVDARMQQLEAYQARINARPSDPIERQCQGRSQRDAAWIRAHPEYVTDPRKLAKLSAAHHDALAEGHDPSSDSYLGHVERFLGLRGASDGDSAQSPRARQQVQRSAGGKVTLKMSAEDDARLRETAESLGLDYKTYLKRYVEARTDPRWADRLD